MARGQQKLQSQAKAAEKQSKLKKQQGHSATDQKKAAQKALVHVCVVCKVCIIITLHIDALSQTICTLHAYKNQRQWQLSETNYTILCKKMNLNEYNSTYSNFW